MHQILSTAGKNIIRRAASEVKSGYERARATILNQQLAKKRYYENHFIPRAVLRPIKGNIDVDRIRPSPILNTSSWQQTQIAFPPLGSGPAHSIGKGDGPLIFKDSGGHAVTGDRMLSYVQILTTPTADTPGTTLMLHFDQKRYLIGSVGEGTQRACVEGKISIIKVEDILLTGETSWRTVGGVLGLMLTLSDALAAKKNVEEATQQMKRKIAVANKSQQKAAKEGKAEGQGRRLRVHGAKNLAHFVATARRFIFRKGLPIDINEFRESAVVKVDGVVSDSKEPTWQDKNVMVWAMAVSPHSPNSSPRKRTHDEISSEDETSASSDSSVMTEDQEERDDHVRKAVVSQMFNSGWQLDALQEMNLPDVVLPATIFVKNAAGKMERYGGPMPSNHLPLLNTKVFVRRPWPAALVESLPVAQPSKSSVSYIIKNHRQRGKFNVQEALRLGVKRGPQFTALANGESVTTAEGNTVTSDMVVGVGSIGGGFAVVDLPSAHYIAPLLQRSEWTSPQVMEGVHAIVWILASGLSRDERLVEFMAKHSTIKHIVSASDCCPDNLAFQSAGAAAMRLNLVDPERFQIPSHNNDAELPEMSSSKRQYQTAKVGKIISLEPKFEIRDDSVLKHLNVQSATESFPAKVAELSKNARKVTESSEYLSKLDKLQKDIPSKDAEIVPLGTGSALPSKYRNVSATLVRVPGYGSYLFDCGENTLGQLKRVYGTDLPTVLRDLKAIWISHLHADHHLGTASVVKAWNESTLAGPLRARRLIVASDDAMLKWLEEYAGVEAYGYPRITPIRLAGRAGATPQIHFSAAETARHGLSSIDACGVDHCHGALACVFSLPNGLRVAYSGDCRPSAEFARIGRGATLLIHEATFDAELRGEALAKKHSTTEEALEVGRRMGARRILLTHFSQRYQKYPVMRADEGAKDQVAIVAFDCMRCRLGDFKKIEEFRPALSELYEGGEAEDE